MHSYLVISAESVEKTVAFVSCYRVEDVVRERERESIRDCCHIELPIVDADSDFPVLLRDDYDQTQPRGPFDRANEPNSE